ncbi:hypothetical protein AGMMS49545_10430 [Betaproteobacteria bacterium]|nr:hypothetical protein AGMMS49545_10430 [Betaproteobacteria bacterium]GHU44370.1 hypothetical protein AGMMS50289_12510 [Betaproteobacteria bacterium]
MTPDDLQALRAYPHFPQGASDLIELVGLAAAARLITAFSGQVIPVPVAYGGTTQGRRNWERIVHLIGEQAAGLLSVNYGGEKLYVPSCKIVMAQHKKERICATFDHLINERAYSTNDAAFEVGLLFNCTGRYVEHIVNGR